MRIQSATRWICLAIVAALSAVQPVLAQEPTPERTTPDYIYNWTARLFYPAAVLFELVVDRPQAEISALTLILQIEGRTEPLVIEVPPAEAAYFSDTYTNLAYIWEIPESDVPPFLSDVTYSWRILTVRDGVAITVDTFTFTDVRAEWIEDQDPDGQLNLIVPAGSQLPRTVRQTVRALYDLLARHTGLEPSFNIALFNNALPANPCEFNDVGEAVIFEPLTERELVCDPAVIETTFSKLGYSVLQIPADTRAAVVPALTRFYLPHFYESAWRSPDVPEWFREGLITFYLPGNKSAVLDTLRSTSRSGSLLSLSEMNAGATGNALWDAQSYGMVLYIASQAGIDGLIDLANRAGQAESFTTLYRDVMEHGIETLLPSVSTWIFTTRAALDFGYVPYQAETATPTPTRTSTPTATHTPTATLTATATASLTLTPTVTGFLSATPLPSLTPTLTNTPAPPSVTPRPAGSLIDTPTPQPTTDNQIAIDGETLAAGIVAAIFVILGVMLVIYLRILNKRGR